MDTISLLNFSLIAFVSFGALSLIYIIKLCVFLYKAEEQEMVSKEEWMKMQTVPLIIYAAFIFFGVLSMILIGQ
ncbi:hypothetical protein ACSFXN_07040 [Planococcus sp. 1R117A]|uniref:hypothetical protein n=1 Tax=Planococcus sp. 1R117A TaxID=3447020 RepID=UPI003EDBCE11